jgi:cation/acetate symporter
LRREAATLTVQFLVLIVLALYARAGAIALGRPISDFYVAGRLVPAMFNGAAIAAALLPVLVFAGLASALGQEGAWVPALGGGVGLVAIGFLLAPCLRKFGGYTVPDFLGERFNRPGIRLLGLLAVILCTFPALALTVLGLGLVITRIFAINLEVAVVLAVVMLLACSFAAGMRSASLTQIVQYAVLLAVSLIALVLLLWQQGTLFPALDAAWHGAALATIKLETFAAEDALNRYALLFCLVTGLAALPHLLARGFVTPSVEEARTSFLWAIPFAIALGFVAAPYLVLFDSKPVGQAGLTATLFFGFVATGAITALLALGSGLLLAVANVLSHDLYYKHVHPAAPTGHLLVVARGAVVAVAGLAAWAALAAPNAVLAMTGAAFSLAASALLPALLLGIWWKRASSQGALAGMLAGLAVCLYYMLAPRYIPFAFYETSSFLSNATAHDAAQYYELSHSYYLADEATRGAALAAWKAAARAVANWGGVKQDFAGLFAVPVGFVVMIAVSLFTPAPEREVQNLVEELRKPGVA